MGKWRHFTDEQSSGMSPDMMTRLDTVVDLCGFNIEITSWVRTVENNQTVGGVSNSSHLRGLAVDIRKPLGEFETLKLVWALGKVGFRRVLIYTKHIHVDIDMSKKQDICLWMGDSH